VFGYFSSARPEEKYPEKKRTGEINCPLLRAGAIGSYRVVSAEGESRDLSKMSTCNGGAQRRVISGATAQEQQQKKKRNVILNEVKNLIKEWNKEGHLGWVLWPDGQSLL